MFTSSTQQRGWRHREGRGLVEVFLSGCDEVGGGKGVIIIIDHKFKLGKREVKDEAALE